MAESQYKDLILETIDSLRKRKARPDMERICHMVERRYGITLEETRADLERLVDAKVVIKVDYKGSTSYRNAAKWPKGAAKWQKLQESLMSDTTRKLLLSIGALLSEAKALKLASEDGTDAPQNAERVSVSTEEIEKRLLEEDPTTNTNDLNLQQQLDKEVEVGRLVKVELGRYVLGDPKTPSKQSSGSSKLSPERVRQLSGGMSPTKKGRPAGAGAVKRKIKTTIKIPKEAKQKKLSTGSTEDEQQHTSSSFMEDPAPDMSSFVSDGPDTQHIPTSDSERELTQLSIQTATPPPPHAPPPASSSSSNPSPVSYRLPTQQLGHQPDPMNFDFVGENGESRCDYCLLTSECNRNGRPEDLLFCKDCQAKAHPSCMDYSEDLAKRARNSPWQCIDCKTCYVCEDSNDPDAMLFCDACDKGYHMNCHNPPIVDKPTGKWVCSKCVMELGLENDEAMESNDSEVGRVNSRMNNVVNGNSADGCGASCLPTPSDSPVHFQDGPHVKDERSSASSSDTRDLKPGFSKMSTSQYNLIMKMPAYHPPQSLPRLADTMPATVPDATEWSIDDVVRFFKDMGFTDQAEVFRDQEIDGRSLLLMRRNDVLTGLSLKLGPALKIYCHVQRLQKRCEQLL